MKKILNKKCLIVVCAAMVLIALAILTAFLWPDGESERKVYLGGDFEYVEIDEHGAEIVGYVGNSKNVAIPTALGGRLVTSVGEYAFSQLDVISVSFGDLVPVRAALVQAAFLWRSFPGSPARDLPK